ncbi:hypothetical protein GGI25_004069 [Coemansia spiralis]|uniref:Uncharacterized protein n=2 Tax=Coemansia TaxID=4863 RepID=A0A9W8KXG5_9FUNG|nr:hypothetical protein EDC05_003289 [Coemansia umbellata]KAJ2620844.1 hypothetical protein GGI26_004639 [Coemansia sp. RSA 1358]KAJ2675229.1 hypothetical protein GGI25_004069 [Coemansia spiralis]
MIAYSIPESVCSQDSLESTNSRACLLPSTAARTPQPTGHLQKEVELEDILARHMQSQSASMEAQRVVLTSAKKRDMQMAQLASALTRMGRLRHTNQDCLSTTERRASDIQGFFDRLDRLAVDKLAVDQRYSPVFQLV